MAQMIDLHQCSSMLFERVTAQRVSSAAMRHGGDHDRLRFPLSSCFDWQPAIMKKQHHQMLKVFAQPATAII